MKNTNRHKLHHKAIRLSCYFLGHDMSAGSNMSTNGKVVSYDYCGRCEGILPGRWLSGLVSCCGVLNFMQNISEGEVCENQR